MKNEEEWLLGNTKPSKGYESNVRSDIKKKIQNFQTMEQLLVIEKGFLSSDMPVTKSCNTVITDFSSQNHQ